MMVASARAELAGGGCAAVPAPPADVALAAAALSDLVVWTADADGRLTAISDNWVAMTGVPAAAVMGRGLAMLVHPEDRAGNRVGDREGDWAVAWMDRLASYRQAGKTLRLAGPDGQYRWWQMRVAPRESGGGWLGTLADVDGSTRRAAQLQASEELYRYTVELSNQIPWTASADGSFVHFNAGWSAVPDGGQAVVPGGSGAVASAVAPADAADDPMHPRDRARVLAARAAGFAQGTPIDHVYRLRGPDGIYAWWRARAAPRVRADGSILRWYGTMENVDAAKRAEEQLRRLRAEMVIVARRNGMGELASTLAHELNQPLATIANYLRGSEALLDGPDGPAQLPAVRGAIANAARSAERAGMIVRRLRELVSRGDEGRAVECPATLIEEACALALMDADALGIGWRVSVEAADLRVVCNRLQIEQVIINLLRNAVDAVRGAERRMIVIAARRVAAGCEISVSDSGAGLAESMRATLFQPFRTSKPDGTGIGLSICRTIVESHGGQINHAPEPEEGARFAIVLPLAAADKTPATTSGAAGD